MSAVAITDAVAPVRDPEVGPAAVEEAVEVGLLDGRYVSYANFDYAASAPSLSVVLDVVNSVLPWYSSVHRGAGLPSQACTSAYEQARDVVREFLGARSNSAVIFTRNTTDSFNLLAHVLPPSTSVVVFDSEHHAALLPWRGRNVIRVPAPVSPELAVEAARTALRRSPVGPRLLCVTGASNVTGECWPIAELAAVAHDCGARIAVDAAQLAPHRRVNIAALDIDYVAISGHKLYAPFGSGALVGRADWLRAAPPYLIGGGATRSVSDRSVSWAPVPERHEAGTPNVVGAIALAAACDTLAADRERLAAREEALLARLRAGLRDVPGLRELELWPGRQRVGITSFTLAGWDGRLLAAALSAEYGIGVRAGAFCAHPFVRRLLEGHGDATPVRASIGVGTTEPDVDRLLAALGQLARRGPAGRYREVDGQFVPEDDGRVRPDVEAWIRPTSNT
ncbi:MAG TPA: aminotransferase class V-fold PLP-dependent enzyme [Mycobacteriales bacterium]|nr:aminotransferase class V-fold PLP-dependent enzyme [Mycobacteriales bacterium]